MSPLVGTPSDDVAGIVATGRANITTVFVSMAARHPDGRDAAYLEWHVLDHQPEQHRLGSLRVSLRLVSTPACRAARAASVGRYDDVDHVMTYLFSDIAGLEEFRVLNAAMSQAGRTPYLLPMVERVVYRLDGMAAAPRIKVGADVVPWWPALGVFVLIERTEVPPSKLIDVAGVGGTWWATGLPMGDVFSSADNSGLQITYCYLDDDPAEAAERLRPVLEKRWADGGITPLLAAPFHTVLRYEWDRYLP
jgi:hypothetical protein